MYKTLLLFCFSNVFFFSGIHAQGFFSTNSYTISEPKGVGANNIFGWGENINSAIDPRTPSSPVYGSMQINYHTGLTFSAHSNYGGIRFYNQGYPGAYDSATGASMVMSITNGNVGIGTINPRAPLDLGRPLGSGALSSVLARLAEGDTEGDGTYLGIKGYNTQSVSGENNYNIKSFALEHSFYGKTNSSVNFFRGSSMTGGSISFNTNDNTERMRILYNGNVGIGVIDPGDKLAVNGTVHAKEVKVDMSGWPDYVFNADYLLTPLDEVKIYIDKNRRLPEMPSDLQVEKEGIKLGEMNKLLTKKVEELTLYLIEKNQQLKDLENRQKKELAIQTAMNQQLLDKMTEMQLQFEKLQDSKK